MTVSGTSTTAEIPTSSPLPLPLPLSACRQLALNVEGVERVLLGINPDVRVVLEHPARQVALIDSST